VPSLSEALFALGLGDRVVGVTDWCVHPAEGVAKLPKLGGTKNPDLEAIRALRPDLVIANREENRRRDVERMRRRASGWVTDPRSVAGAMELLELRARRESARGRDRPDLAGAGSRGGAGRPRPAPAFCRSGSGPGWRSGATPSRTTCCACAAARTSSAIARATLPDRGGGGDRAAAPR
jgi:hypothetical protein